MFPVSQGPLVYANYGRRSDFRFVRDVLPNGTCEGAVVLMRYGAVSKAEKVSTERVLGEY